MRPLGRKHFKPPSLCKHKVKSKGKNIEGWWESVCGPDKKSDRRRVNMTIRKGYQPPPQQ